MRRNKLLGVVGGVSSCALVVACGGWVDLAPPDGVGGGGSGPDGGTSAQGGSNVSAGTGTVAGGVAGSSVAQGGAAAAAGTTTTAGVGSGTAGSVTVGGGDSGGAASGGAGGGGGGAGGGGGGGGGGGAYAPRSGPFKMIVYSRQGPGGYRHAASITTGKTMLAAIAQQQGFEIVHIENDADNSKYITPEGLAPFEIIFFLNSTSDIFNAAQQKTYEDWMTQKNGAFVGVHSATDTENGWAFYSEVTGQYYNGHGISGTPDQIQLEPSALDFPALKGIPNPWQRNEEWYKFNSWQQWSTKPGFKILGKKAADGQPIMWAREYGNFRAFYTAIGHDAVVFEDATVKKHITGGIMWAVRREHLIK